MDLQTYLHNRNMTDVAFAAVVGRNPSQVSRWRRGETIPDTDAMRAIAEATGNLVTPNDFVLDGTPAPDGAD